MQKYCWARGLIGLLLTGIGLFLVACVSATPNQPGPTATPNRPGMTSTATLTATSAQAQFVIYTSGAKGTPDTINVLRASDGTLLWHYPTEGGAIRGLKIVGGVVYAGTYRGNVYAFRVSDGKLLWQTQFDGILTWLDVVDSVVYLNINAYSTPAQPAQPFVALYALRATDGSSLWQRQLNNFPTTDAVSSQAVLSDGMIYATINVSIANPTGSGYQPVMGSLSAFSTSDGCTLWNYSMLDNTAPLAPMVADGVVYASTVRYDQNDQVVPGMGIVYALQESNGSLLWKYQDSVSSYFDPQAVSNGRLYVEGEEIRQPGSLEINYVYALRTNDGSLLWRDQLTNTNTNNGDNIPTALTVLNDMIYVGESEQAPGAGTGTVFALRASDGKVIWHGDIANIGDTDVEVLVADGMVYVGQTENMVSALRPNDGALLWRYKLSESGALKLAASNGIVYVGTYPDLGGGRSVCALQASTGTKLWCHQVDAGIILLQVS